MSEIWTPYKPPTVAQRGWKVGPIALDSGLADANAEGLPSNVSVDQQIISDLASANAIGLPSDVSNIPIQNCLIASGIAEGVASGISTEVKLDVPIASGLAVGSAVALEPTLSLVNPPQYANAGSNDRGSSSTTPTATSWSHTSVPASPFVVLMFVFADTDGTSVSVSGTPTFGGYGLSLAFSASVGSGSLFRCYRVFSPPVSSATANLTLTRSGGTTMSYFVNTIIYSGATSIVTGSSAASTSANPSMNASSAVGETVVGAFGGRNISSLTNPNSRYSNHQNVIGLSVGDAPGDGSTVNFSTVASSGQWWGGIWMRLT